MAFLVTYDSIKLKPPTQHVQTSTMSSYQSKLKVKQGLVARLLPLEFKLRLKRPFSINFRIPCKLSTHPPTCLEFDAFPILLCSQVCRDSRRALQSYRKSSLACWCTGCR